MNTMLLEPVELSLLSLCGSSITNVLIWSPHRSVSRGSAWDVSPSLSALCPGEEGLRYAILLGQREHPEFVPALQESDHPLRTAPLS